MWIFHNFPSVVHISSISLIFLTFSQHVDWWHSPPKTLVDTADSFAAGLFEQWKKALFFFGWIPWETVLSTEFRLYLVGGLEHDFIFHYFPYIGKKYLKWISYFSEKLNSPTSYYYVCILQFIQSYVYIYIIVLYVYICIYNRVLRTKWLMMVRYASETWVNIHVSYCWCGWDPWDQHLCCFHHQSHLDTDAGAVGLWSFSKPQTNITLKHILNDTV